MPGASSFRHLEEAGASSSGRPIGAEDPSSEKKVHLHPNTGGETYIRKFEDLARNFKPQNEEEHEFHIQVLNSICARFGKNLTIQE